MPKNVSNPLVFTLAFYGIDCDSERLQDLYDLTVRWFHQMELPPERLGVQGEGFSGKFTPFSRADKKLRRSAFNVESIEIESARLGLKCVEDYEATAVISRKSMSSYAVFSASIERFSLLTKKDWTLAVSFVDILRPEYGIGYSLPLRSGPTLFALGINAGGPIIVRGEEYELQVRVSAWGSTGKSDRVYRQGLLRDVYPWNFLTEPQLSRPLNGRSLQDWINEDPRRGRLAPFAGNVSVWEVDESQIPTLHSTLWEAGAIFDMRRFR